jgi:hypothetical protein
MNVVAALWLQNRHAFRVFSALVPSFPKYHGFVVQGVFNVGWIRILCGTKCQVVEQLPDSNKTLSI